MRPAIALVVGITVGLSLLLVPACGPPEPLARGRLAFGEGAATLDVEIAETDEAIARGLTERPSLAPDAGMAFLFDEPHQGYFWMKDTLIPLSIAFWGADGRVVAMLDMQPCAAEPCEHYEPGVDYVGAAEANLGWFDEHGVEVGDAVELQR